METKTNKIEAKLAAIELIRKDKTVINISVGAIVAMVLVSVSAIFHPYIPLVFIIVVAVFGILQIRKAQQEIQYLSTKYRVDPNISRTIITQMQEAAKNANR